MRKYNRFVVFVALLCMNIVTNEAQEPKLPLDESSAEDLIAQIDEVYVKSATSYRKSTDDTLSPEIIMREKLRPFYSIMESYDWKNFQNVTLKRQFEVILRGAKYPPIDYKFKRATANLKTLSRHKWACKRETPNSCNMAFVHHIKSIFTNSDDLDELQYYWQEWRNKLPNDIKQSLLYYVNYYKNLTTPTMNATSIWYDQYEDPNFIDELESLMDSIRPFYRQLHAHVCNVLRMKYGENVIPPSGLIPHHLMEQVTYQAWKKDSVLQNPFPENRLPNLQAEMDDYQLQAFDLVNMSAQFFVTLGFQSLNDEFIRSHFFKMERGTGGPDCKSRIYDYGEIEMNYCPKVYYKKLLQTHGDMARVQYAIAKNRKPVGLNQEAFPGFGNALGEAIILSVSNPKHLQKRLGLLQNYEYDDILNLNRLYRLAVHTLLTLPTYFVHEKLWVDMISGAVQPENYNCHYWNLMQKYMGVDAPIETLPGTYDMPYKFYEGVVDQTRSTKKIVGEILGYQIYRAICFDIDEFQTGNAYKTLDNCDFSHNEHAGELVKDMMSSGSSMPWREVIKPLTSCGLPKLTATGFLEYFEPLHNWLSEDNLEKNINVEWKTYDKCKAVPA